MTFRNPRQAREFLTDRLLVDATLKVNDISDLAKVRDEIFTWTERKLPHGSQHLLQRGWRDQSFGVTGGLRVETVGGDTLDKDFIWSFRLHHPDEDFLDRRHWAVETTLAVMAKGGGHFALRLSTHDSSPNLPKPVPSTPAFLGQILRSNILWADGRPMRSGYTHLKQPDRDLAPFMQLLQDTKRTRPVILIPAMPSAWEGEYLDISQIVRTVPGMAHLFICSYEFMNALTDRLGSGLHVDQGFMRVFRPGYTLDDSQAENPVISMKRGPKNRGALIALKHMVNGWSLQRSDANDVAPRFAEIKHIFQQARLREAESAQRAVPVPGGVREPAPVSVPRPAPAPASQPAPVPPPILHSAQIEVAQVEVKPEPVIVQGPDPRDLRIAELERMLSSRDTELARMSQQAVDLSGLVSGLRDENKTLEELLAVGDGERARLTEGMAGTQSQLAQTQRQLEEAKARIANYEAQSVKGPKAASAAIFPPLSEFPEWAKVYAPHVAFSESALKEVVRSQYQWPAKVYGGILALETWRLMRLHGLDALRPEYLAKLREAGLESSPTSSAGMSRKYKDSYTFIIPGVKEPVYMDQHLKAGNSFEPRHTLRIYYASDLTPENKVAVGSLPKHLVSSLS